MPAPAKDLYVSELFRRARAYVEATGCQWFILSAKHGFVDPDEVIAPYEQTLNTMCVAERRKWAEKVRAQMDERSPLAERIVVIAGKRYRGVSDALLAPACDKSRGATGGPPDRTPRLATLRESNAERLCQPTMKIYRIANLAVLSFVLSIGFAAAARADDKAVPGWDPAVFHDASTIKIMITEPDVGEHWSNLWVVVIDGQPYVRLGDRAYGRIQRNTTSPYVKLKVADREFDKVKVEEMPDMKQKVAASMADKYWMDILVRHESHPMVARLVPETPPSETPSH
jgi:hypothetical protein